MVGRINHKDLNKDEENTFTITHFVSGYTGVVAQQFDYGKIAPHPRLLLPAGRRRSHREAIAEYPLLTTVHQRIMELCDRTLTEQPVERIKEGKRLLAISRIALKRIYYLSYAYRMTGDKKYAHRAEQEMLPSVVSPTGTPLISWMWVRW